MCVYLLALLQLCLAFLRCCDCAAAALATAAISPGLTLLRLPLPASVQPRLRSRQRAAHVDVAVAVGVAGKKVLKSAPLCRCDVSLSLTIAQLSRDLVLSAESSKTIYFAHPRIFTFDNNFFFHKFSLI